MPSFSEAFGIDRNQAELDFVNVSLNRDTPLFVDPFAISKMVNPWALEAHQAIHNFFDAVVSRIRDEDVYEARSLLRFLQEPNETRLGLSSGRPQGAGVGRHQADLIFQALSESSAVKTGFLKSLEESELMIEGVGRDKISDITTNIIRGILAEYTITQANLHGIPTRSVPLPPVFDIQRNVWRSAYHELPVYRQQPILLVPKAIVRYDPAYQYPKYYRHFVLEFLQREHLEAGSSLVHALKNGRRVVYKRELEEHYPCTKEFLYQFSSDHQEVLEDYEHYLSEIESDHSGFVEGETDERVLADALSIALNTIGPGSEDASEYHRLMVGVVEFLLFPSLLHPSKENEINEGRKRIDILMENGARDGIFWRLHSTMDIPCGFVPIECKNYRRDIGNPELDQLIGRFSTNRGRVGMVCCRGFEDRDLFMRRCRDTYLDGHGKAPPISVDT